MLIVNGTVHTMEVGTIPSGFVQTEGTRIVRVGPMSDLPGAGDADGIIDAKGGHILPGFGTAKSRLNKARKILKEVLADETDI